MMHAGVINQLFVCVYGEPNQFIYIFMKRVYTNFLFVGCVPYSQSFADQVPLCRCYLSGSTKVLGLSAKKIPVHGERALRANTIREPMAARR